MKPLFFTIIFYCFFINTANAQLDKGYWFTGGDASFISTSNSPYTSTQKNSSTEIAPTIGYFFFDKFSAGIKFDVSFVYSSYGTSVNGPIITSNTNGYQFGPYVRYYFLNKDKIVNLFAEANYEYGITRYKNSGVSQNPSNGQQVTFLAGPAFFFTQSVALEFTAGYYYSFSNTGGQHNGGVQMGIGFMIHLERAD